MRRILFVSCFFASDFESMVWGPFLRMRIFLEAACRAAPAVDLLLFAADDMVASADREAIAASIRRAWRLDVRVFLAPRRNADRSIIERLSGELAAIRNIRRHADYGRASGPSQANAVRAAILADTDLVVAQKLEAALPVADSGRGDVTMVMDIDDIEHISFGRRVAQRTSLASRMIGRLQLSAVHRGERQTLQRFDSAFVCSQVDADVLACEVDGTSIEVVPNALAFSDEEAVTRAGSKHTIVYFGSYAYQPNVDAAEELIHRIFPLVVARCPSARLLIVGAFAEKLPSFAKPLGDGVRIVGFVKDVADVYREAAAACCPIRAGGGTRIKIIEASAWRIPTVATRIAAEGLALEDGTEILLAEDSEALADRCVELLTSPQRAAAIGDAAFRKARSLYDRTAVVAQVERLYRDAYFRRATRGIVSMQPAAVGNE